jgi:hypothetical protein
VAADVFVVVTDVFVVVADVFVVVTDVCCDAVGFVKCVRQLA